MANRALVDRFCAFLRGKALPVTDQRMVIADVMLSATDHMAADDVVTRLKEQGHEVGLATIYRTIDLLLESGLLVERNFGEGFRRFEPARDMPQHEHLLCTSCGAVEEFRDERIEQVTHAIAEARGFSRERHHLVIRGTCRTCQDAAPATSRRPS